MNEQSRINELKGIGEKTEKLFQKLHINTIGDLIRYEKRNKIKGNTKLDTFVCTGVRFGKDDSEQTLSNGTKEKKMKFCSVLCSGCTPYIGFRKSLC